MRAKTVLESIHFRKGKSPIEDMGIGHVYALFKNPSGIGGLYGTDHMKFGNHLSLWPDTENRGLFTVDFEKAKKAAIKNALLSKKHDDPETYSVIKILKSDMLEKNYDKGEQVFVFDPRKDTDI